MNGHLITTAGVDHPVEPDMVRGLLDRRERFWLDLDGLADGGSELLRDTFGFHPLAVEDAEHFGQRPKVDPYDHFTLLVVHGVDDRGEPIEVHCFYTDTFLVTVHRDPVPGLAGVVQRLRQNADHRGTHIMVLYRVLDVLVDTFFPVLADFDDAIDDLEDDILQRPTEAQLGRLFQMKRSLVGMRKVVTPQRDMLAAELGGAGSLPGMNRDAERYFRDLYDHLIRISDLVDSYRDLLSGALDTHLSTVSNRLNVVMKQLTIIATVFLPMSFLTGFFGQNFGWMVDRLGGMPVFFIVGVGSQVLALAVLLLYFRRRGWLTERDTGRDTERDTDRDTRTGTGTGAGSTTGRGHRFAGRSGRRDHGAASRVRT